MTHLTSTYDGKTYKRGQKYTIDRLRLRGLDAEDVLGAAL